MQTTTVDVCRAAARASESGLAPSPSTFRSRGLAIVASATGSGSTTTIGSRQRREDSAAMSAAVRAFAPKTTTSGRVKYRVTTPASWSLKSAATPRAVTSGATNAATHSCHGTPAPSGMSRLSVNRRTVR